MCLRRVFIGIYLSRFYPINNSNMSYIVIAIGISIFQFEHDVTLTKA